LGRVLRLRHLLLAGLLPLAGCGGGGDEPTGSTPSATTAPTAAATATPTAPPPVATASSAPSPPPDAPTPTATPTGESQPGGGGDEAGARIPVAITVGSDGTLSPQRVSIPAFFAVELQIRNRTAGTLKVRWNDAEDFTVGAGRVGTHRVAPVGKGTYPLDVQGVGRATVVAGGEPGP
jgi:hypothetical protein